MSRRELRGVMRPMSEQYTPTTDEVDTGFTTFAWELEKEKPGTYGHGFENYHEVCASFRRWLAEVERKAAEKAWDEGFAHSVRTVFHDRMPRLEDNPYRKGVQS